MFLVNEPMCSSTHAHGVSLQAAVRIASHPRRELEPRCRAIARPALPNERLSRNAQGQAAPLFKTP